MAHSSLYGETSYVWATVLKCVFDVFGDIFIVKDSDVEMEFTLKTVCFLDKAVALVFVDGGQIL